MTFHPAFSSQRRSSAATVVHLGQNVAMRANDFFVESQKRGGDPWGGHSDSLNESLLDRLARGPIPGDDDLATATSLARLVHEEYLAYGTGGDETFTKEESRVALRTLRLVLKRHDIDFKPPWRDFDTFYTHWKVEGCSNSYQRRRDLLEKWFRPVQDHLEEAEEVQLQSELVNAVSPRDKTGWNNVDADVEQLRLRFRSASTVQDYKDVGNRCVGVLEALSATVYDPAIHCPDGMIEPPVDKTDIRIGAYIDQRLPGKQNEELRGLVKKASALAHKVKHSPRADRTSAGIAADAAILIANMVRRLAE